MDESTESVRPNGHTPVRFSWSNDELAGLYPDQQAPNRVLLKLAFPDRLLASPQAPDRRRRVSQETDLAVYRASLHLGEPSNAVLWHAIDDLPLS